MPVATRVCVGTVACSLCCTFFYPGALGLFVKTDDSRHGSGGPCSDPAHALWGNAMIQRPLTSPRRAQRSGVGLWGTGSSRPLPCTSGALLLSLALALSPV